jgi:hypothetical protein
MRFVVLAIAMWVSAGTAAVACISPSDETGIVYATPPPAAQLPPEALVLDVAFDTATLRRGPVGDLLTATARVRRVVRGAYTQPTIDVVVSFTSCSRPFLFGTEGFIVVRHVELSPGDPLSYAAQEHGHDD